MELENQTPNVYEKLSSRILTDADEDENVVDPFDEREIFGKLLKHVFYKTGNLSFNTTPQT